MKTTLALLVSSALLASCGTTGNTLPASIAAIESAVQADASAICQFEPTLATVAQIISSLFPGGGAVDAIAAPIAQQICSAVTALPVPVAGRLRTAIVYYPGTNIQIHGTFLSVGRRHHARP